MSATGPLRPPAPLPARPFAPPPFVTRTMPTGLTLSAARWGKRPTVAVSILFPGAGNTGDPAGKEGASEITADTFLGGTAARSSKELAEAIDDMAAILEVSAGADAAVARLFVLEKDLDEGLALLSEVIGTPSFPEEEVEKSRRRQIDLLVEQRSEPDFLARERLLDRLYPDHPYGRLTASEAGLLALTRDDVAAFHRERYDVRGATLVVAGAADPERLLLAAEKAFATNVSTRRDGEAVLAPAPRIEGFSIHLVNRPGSVQTNLLFARPALRRSDGTYTAATVANQSLGGGASARLFHVLREERGLTYGAYSSLSPRRYAGHFAASIDCRTEVTKEAASGLLDLVRAFAIEGPSEEEHGRSIQFLRGSFTLARETPGAIVQDEVTRRLHGLPEDEFVTWRDRVSAVSREEARAVAAEHFDPKTGVLAAVGDAERIRPILDRFGDTTLWDADGPRR